MDNTDIEHSAKNVNTKGEGVLSDIQNVIDAWEGGLRATGGAIVPEKRYWYLIHFFWNGKKWKYRSIEKMPGNINIRTVNGNNRQ